VGGPLISQYFGKFSPAIYGDGVLTVRLSCVREETGQTPIKPDGSTDKKAAARKSIFFRLASNQRSVPA
jgi:hypothetical protein